MSVPSLPKVPSADELFSKLDANDPKKAQDLFDELDDAPESVPLFKFAEPGDQIQGISVHEGSMTNEYGTSVILHLQDRDGTVRAVGMFGARLGNWYERTQPPLGSAIRIRYVGLEKTKNGKAEYRDYAIAYVPAKN
jgi:hypothetical protein